MSERKPLSVGIDVSKDTLAVAIRFADAEQHLTVPNTKNGITALSRKLRRPAYPLIMESTSRYHILPALLLTQHGHDVRVVNPVQAKRYMTSSTRNRKTDKSDASALAQMGVTDQRLPPSFAITIADLQLRQKISLLASLEHKLQSLNHVMRDYRGFQKTVGIINSPSERGVQTIVKAMERQRIRLERDIEATILRDDAKRQAVGLAASVPGISSTTASILCEVLDRDCASAKQWIAFVGYDVAERQSGTWHGRGKLSKRGNPYLRKRLFRAAWGAVQNEECFHTYYERLRAQGRSYREAIVIVARKLLRIVFAVLKNQTPFDPACCSLPI